MYAQPPTPSTLRRLARWAWYPTALAALVLLVVSIPGYVAGFPLLETPVEQSSPAVVALLHLLSVLTSLTCAVLCIGLATLLFVRRADDSMALFVSYYLLGYGVLMGGPLEAALTGTGIPSTAAYSLQTGIVLLPTIILLFTFPSGHFVPGWLVWLALLGIPLTTAAVLQPSSDWLTFSSIPTRLIIVAIFVLLIIGTVAQFYRYRRISGIVERQQTKWVIGGLVLWFLYMLMTFIPWLIASSRPAGTPAPLWERVVGVGWWLGLLIVPVSLTIAILRSRLFAIDIIIRRTLVYGLLTLMLALIYFGTVVLMQAVFVALSGQQSPLSIVISTLLIAALFTPLRRRIQNVIDRRFFRRRYDSAQILSRFGRTARDEVELDDLSKALLAAVSETMQPESLGLWVRGVRPHS